MSDKYQVAYEAFVKQVDDEYSYPKELVGNARLSQAWVAGFKCAVDGMSAQPVSVAYEFNPRSARQVIVDPATGKKWFIPLVSEEAWREDSTAMLDRCCEGGSFGEKHDCMKSPGIPSAAEVEQLVAWRKKQEDDAYARAKAAYAQQSPQSVYGCDPATVNLSNLRGPNGRPVRMMAFREPTNPELWLLADMQLMGLGTHWHGSEGADKRRIIVEEIPEPKKARRFVFCEVLSGGQRWPHELPSLDDPKVLDELGSLTGLNSSNTRAVVKKIIEAYLSMGK